MWSSDSDPDLAAAATATASSSSSSSPPPPRRRRHRHSRRRTRRSHPDPGGADAEDVWRGAQWEAAWPRRTKPVVVADEPGAGASAPAGGDDGGVGVGRARSLTDDDLEELKGCVDLGFGFSYDEIPELCGTLPALELCYSMSQRFLDDRLHPHAPPETAAPPSPSPPIPNWKISSPVATLIS
ncbi:uncharacterized protein LOC102713151 isoform X2 [Oryza brachyantha]|uniref:uncharacterized protein LOC102713151 isoform X2 n=1 Tax=Oryza brachyantha TaxID=4533 RepID=UPI001ADBAD23|nr:uncharacterized protein LOC102713151 isoform X2 [Oryza brachyantha]